MEDYFLNNLTKRKTNKKEKESYLGSISLAMSSFLEYFLSLLFNLTDVQCSYDVQIPGKQNTASREFCKTVSHFYILGQSLLCHFHNLLPPTPTCARGPCSWDFCLKCFVQISAQSPEKTACSSQMCVGISAVCSYMFSGKLKRMLNINLSYGVAVIQWATSCHKICQI